ncbi:MAG: hypothetical protein JWP61_1187 [Friedmanniella sp.]|nr:hypothetical protein [Friedmanniella sp.]
MGKPGFRVLRILGGVVVMLALVGAGLLVLTRYAGGWGVPYFSFVSERGSTCRNDLTGYTCSPVTLADVEFYADVDLPEGTQVLSGSYRSTHDYRLEAVLRADKAHAAATLKSLQKAFGRCQPDHPSGLDAEHLSKVCVLSNDGEVTQSGEPSSRLYTVGTGLAKDGTREIALAIRSR